jgi:hypothetical protein
VADAVNAAAMPAVVLLPGLDGTGKLFAARNLRTECRPTPIFARLGRESLLATVFFVAGRLS